MAADVRQDQGDVAGVRIGLREREPDLANGDANARTDLQKLQADRRALRFLMLGAFEAEARGRARLSHAAAC